MKKKILPLLAIPFIIFMGSCATTKTAQIIDQDDDVYYSVAKAKEYVPQTIVQNEEKRTKEYVTEENLYGDAIDNYGYYNDYASRFNRFGTYAPSLGYYNSLYGYNYDPFFNNLYFPNSYLGMGSYNLGFGMGLGMGFGGFNYNPWRPFGFNYGFGSNFWGPYSFYNPFNSYAFGYGNGYYGGAYAGLYSSPAFNTPNYRSRPGRGSDNLTIDRGSVIGRPNTVGTRDANGNVVPRSRTERYGVQTQPNAGATQNSGTRTQQVNRPERVNQNPPQRVAQPERIYTAPPRQDSGSGSRSTPAPSNNNGGGSSSARPSRGN
ncbi:hypothetical protein [Daejeonella sp.]|uniref:hypothetical protein n=1 Tax=Daejeonella sp. TaxID=2805397 RepID=UPI0025BAAB6E|nr:hypothetical protein [Daejeonella sp.]